MAKKTALKKALDKRKKKPAKKAIKQATPQSESYSVRRDKKQKAKPAGYRFKGLDNFKTPTKKDIAADSGKPKSKRKTYFENRKDKSDKAPSKKFAKGGIAVGKIGQELAVFMSDADSIHVMVHEYDTNEFILMIRKKGHQSMGLGNKTYKSFAGAAKSALLAFKKNVPGLSQKLIEVKYKATESNKSIHIGGMDGNYEALIKEDRKTVEKKTFKSLNAANKYALSFFENNIKKFELGGDINAHSGDSAITIQNEMFAGGGELTRDQEIAATILQQLGGIRKLQAMTGAHTFIAHPSGVSFKIKNPKVNYIKIILNSKDLYDLEFGRIKGDKYTVVNKLDGYYDTMLKDAFEKETGMYLSLEQGGPILPEDATQSDVFENGGEAKKGIRVEGLELDRIFVTGKMEDIEKIKTVLESLGFTQIKDRPNAYEFKTGINASFGNAFIDNPTITYLGMPISMATAEKISEALAENVKLKLIAANADIMADGGEVANDNIVENPEVEIKPEIEVKLETTQKATIPNVEAAAYAENLIDFMGTNLEGKKLPNGDYVVLSFLFYPIWFYSAKDQKWYGNSDKYNSVTALHASSSRPTPNAEMLSLNQLMDKMNQGIQTYDLGGVLVRQLYPMTTDNTTIVHQ